jgi:tetratricopeptide (TPR) repeat protein
VDDGETSARGALVLFLVVCAAIFAAWVVLGPGHVLVVSVFQAIQQALQSLAVWYQSAVEGPTKLIAPAITIASGSYAIYKGYKYAGSRLHYRLHDFIAREEERLKDAREQLRLIIERPNVERRFREPIFLEKPLKNAVRELGWGSYFLGPQLGYVRFQLDNSITHLERQVKASKERHKHLEHQLATAHLLRGAMYVADASAHSPGDGRPHIASALGHFESALVVDPADREALEYAAHMYVIMKQDNDAEDHLERLFQVTAKEAKSLSRARAFRYKSDLDVAHGQRTEARRAAKSALKALPNLHGEDRIEEAEMQEIVGDRQIVLHAHIQARSHWEIAEALFDQIMTPEAKVGLERVRAKLANLNARPDRDLDADEDDDG